MQKNQSNTLLQTKLVKLKGFQVKLGVRVQQSFVLFHTATLTLTLLTQTENKEPIFLSPNSPIGKRFNLTPLNCAFQSTLFRKLSVIINFSIKFFSFFNFNHGILRIGTDNACRGHQFCKELFFRLWGWLVYY